MPAIAAAATTFLQDLTTPATEAVQHTPLPDTLVPVVRTVLEQKHTLGSDAVFVAGRLDLPGPSHPQGRALFLWMGDARLRLFTAHQEVSRNLGGVFERKRWSSRRGLVNGPLNLFASPIGAGQHALSRVLAYSDGLPSLDHLPTSLATLISQAYAAPTSDDISLLDIRLAPPQVS